MLFTGLGTFNCAVCLEFVCLEFFPQGKQDLNTSIDLLEGELCNNYYCVQQETYYYFYVIFHSLWFYPVPRALIADAWSFQTLTAILDDVTHFASISCCIDPMANKMNLDYLTLLYCTFQKYEVMTMCVVGGQPKKKPKLTVFLELRSAKTVRFSEQIMSADKYPSIFSLQMKAIVYLLIIYYYSNL